MFDKDKIIAAISFNSFSIYYLKMDSSKLPEDFVNIDESNEGMRLLKGISMMTYYAAIV